MHGAAEKEESYMTCIKCCTTWKVFGDKLYSKENALPNIHVHRGRLRIREDFETGNLEKFHSLLTGAPTASTGRQQSSGSDEMVCKVLLSKSSNTCKHPNQTHLMGVEASQGQSGVRAGEGRASSAENVQFIVG